MHPQPEEESIFRTFFAGHVRLYLDRLLRATTKKGQLFWQKSAPPRQNPGYAYGCRNCTGWVPFLYTTH